MTDDVQDQLLDCLADDALLDHLAAGGEPTDELSALIAAWIAAVNAAPIP